MRDGFKTFSSASPPSVGIIGGGQLGKMIALEAKRMGLRVNVLDPKDPCPAKSVCDTFIKADFSDEEAVRKLASESDVVTFEIELADDRILQKLEREGHILRHPPSTLALARDKFKQKLVLRENRIPTADFLDIGFTEDERELSRKLAEAGEKLRYPFLVKVKKGGYDGRGNLVVSSPAEIEKAVKFIMSKGEVYAERFVRFSKEISVIATRAVENGKDKIITFEVSENTHDNGILLLNITPADIPEKLREKAKELARKVIRVFGGIGTFGIEMFVEGEQILINEIAPRVHNTGHWTLDFASISQFEAHLRAIMGLPLPEPQMLCKHVAMINILGSPPVEGTYKIPDIDKLLSIPNLKLHIYGKPTNSGRRKLGHVTLFSETREELDGLVQKVFSILRVEK